MAGAGGYLFIFGGITVQGYSNELWMFNLESNNYELLNSQGNVPLRSARGNCKAYETDNNDIIFETFLGETNGRRPLTGVYRYTLSNRTWTEMKKNDGSIYARSQAVALYLEDKILVAGGAVWNVFVEDEILAYDISDNQVSKLDTLPHNIYNAASVFYKNKLYIHGGAASFSSLPLPTIPMNNLIVIELDDSCSEVPVFCNSQCSLGSYFKNDECESCPKGSYRSTHDIDKCEKCPEGYYSDIEGADNSSFCQPCKPGTYNQEPGLSYCYDCPSGSECSLDKIETGSNAYLQTQLISEQPEVYSSKETIVREYNSLSSLILAICSTILLLILISIPKTRKFLISIDYYSLQHNYQSNQPMVIRQTLFGGLATAVFLVVAISVSVSIGLSYGLDNILETKALVHLEALQQEYGTVTYI
jgi:hypothetical protein